MSTTPRDLTTWSKKERSDALNTLADLLASTMDNNLTREDVKKALKDDPTSETSWRERLPVTPVETRLPAVNSPPESMVNWQCPQCLHGNSAPDVRKALRKKGDAENAFPPRDLSCQGCGAAVSKDV